MARFQFVQCELQHSQRIVQPGPHDGLSCLQLGSDLRRRPAQVIRQTNHGAVRRGQTASRRRGSAADPAACSRRDMHGSRESNRRGVGWPLAVSQCRYSGQGWRPKTMRPYRSHNQRSGLRQIDPRIVRARRIATIFSACMLASSATSISAVQELIHQGRRASRIVWMLMYQMVH